MAKIEVSTTQNVVIQYDTAGFLWRFIAWLIDTTIVFVLYFILLYFLLTILAVKFSDTNFYIVFTLIFLFRVLYSLFIEIFTNGQSIGKKIVGICVIKLNGNALEISDYLIRWAYRALDFGLSGYTIGPISIFMSSKNQRLGDMIAGTTVIKLKPERIVTLDDLRNLPDKDEYVPKFPLVTRYNDVEMLALKNLLVRYQQYRNPTYTKLLAETVSHLKEQMDLTNLKMPDADFLKEVISEYVILTR